MEKRVWYGNSNVVETGDFAVERLRRYRERVEFFDFFHYLKSVQKRLKLSTHEIAKTCGVTMEVVNSWMRKQGSLPSIDQQETYMDMVLSLIE